MPVTSGTEPLFLTPPFRSDSFDAHMPLFDGVPEGFEGAPGLFEHFAAMTNFLYFRLIRRNTVFVDPELESRLEITRS